MFCTYMHTYIHTYISYTYICIYTHTDAHVKSSNRRRQILFSRYSRDLQKTKQVTKQGYRILSRTLYL